MNSATITKIAPALLEAQKSMGDAKKGAANPFFRSTYADLNAVREAAIPVLNAVGISVLQPTITENGKNYVRTLLLHESGEFLSSLTEIRNTKGDAQSEGSGISYARRYGLQSFLNIGAVDDDGEATMTRDTKPAAKVETPVAKSSFKKATIVAPATNGQQNAVQTEADNKNMKAQIAAAQKEVDSKSLEADGDDW